MCVCPTSAMATHDGVVEEERDAGLGSDLAVFLRVT